MNTPDTNTYNVIEIDVQPGRGKPHLLVQLPGEAWLKIPLSTVAWIHQEDLVSKADPIHLHLHNGTTITLITDPAIRENEDSMASYWRARHNIGEVVVGAQTATPRRQMRAA